MAKIYIIRDDLQSFLFKQRHSIAFHMDVSKNCDLVFLGEKMYMIMFAVLWKYDQDVAGVNHRNGTCMCLDIVKEQLYWIFELDRAVEKVFYDRYYSLTELLLEKQGYSCKDSSACWLLNMKEKYRVLRNRLGYFLEK